MNKNAGYQRINRKAGTIHRINLVCCADLDKHEKAILLACLQYANPITGEDVWMSMQTIADMTGLSLRRVQLSVTLLKERGILVYVATRAGGTKEYRINYRVLEANIAHKGHYWPNKKAHLGGAPSSPAHAMQRGGAQHAHNPMNYPSDAGQPDPGADLNCQERPEHHRGGMGALLIDMDKKTELDTARGSCDTDIRQTASRLEQLRADRRVNETGADVSECLEGLGLSIHAP